VGNKNKLWYRKDTCMGAPE